MEKRKKERKRGEKERERLLMFFLLFFYPESPTAGFGSLLCFLCLSLVLSPPPLFFSPSISHSPAVSSHLTHSLPCLHSRTRLFSGSTCSVSPFTPPQSRSFSLLFLTFSSFSLSVSVITDSHDSQTIFIPFVVFFSPQNLSECSFDSSLPLHLLASIFLSIKETTNPTFTITS